MNLLEFSKNQDQELNNWWNNFVNDSWFPRHHHGAV